MVRNENCRFCSYRIPSYLVDDDTPPEKYMWMCSAPLPEWLNIYINNLTDESAVEHIEERRHVYPTSVSQQCRDDICCPLFQPENPCSDVA